MRIAESRSSTWFYHLSDDPSSLAALCGAQTMACTAPLGSWGAVTHVGERYCPACDRLCVPEPTTAEAVEALRALNSAIWKAHSMWALSRSETGKASEIIANWDRRHPEGTDETENEHA